MDLRLSEEERLIRDTAAQFVAKELLSREGAFLKQKEPFVPPGDPPRRMLDGEIEKTLVEKAKRIGLWALELPESAGGSSVGQVARVLIYREFGRTALPFEPPPIPAAVATSRYARELARGGVPRGDARGFHTLRGAGQPGPAGRAAAPPARGPREPIRTRAGERRAVP